MSFKNHLREVSSVILEQRAEGKNGTDTYNSRKLKVLNIGMSKERQLAKQGFSFSNCSYIDIVPIWHYIWQNSEYLEVRRQALFFFEKNLIKDNANAIYQDLISFCDDIDNWAFSDAISSMLSKCLEEDYSKVIIKLRNWNSSNDLWQRRQSLVCLFYYQSLRKKYPKIIDVLLNVEQLLDDNEYYVQKGLGWTLIIKQAN